MSNTQGTPDPPESIPPAPTSSAGLGRGRYAASPGEPVLSPSLFSTLFPHLEHDQVNEFRWALLGGLIGLAVLVIAGLITAAIILAAFLVPVLYVMYLYEARVYRDAPVPVVGFTIGGGILLGILLTALSNRLIPDIVVVASTPFGVSIDVTGLLTVALVLPLVKELVKPLPALLLRGRPDLSQTVDGLVLGVAAGLGYSIAETLIRFSQILTSRDFDTAAAGWIYPLLSVAIFVPVLSGSTTGLITAAVWRWRRGHGLGAIEVGGIILALVSSVAYVMGAQLLVGFGLPQIIALGWELLIVGLVLVYVRVVLQKALTDEARELGLPDPTRPLVEQGPA